MFPFIIVCISMKFIVGVLNEADKDEESVNLKETTVQILYM